MQYSTLLILSIKGLSNLLHTYLKINEEKVNLYRYKITQSALYSPPPEVWILKKEWFLKPFPTTVTTRIYHIWSKNMNRIGMKCSYKQMCNNAKTFFLPFISRERPGRLTEVTVAFPTLRRSVWVLSTWIIIRRKKKECTLEFSPFFPYFCVSHWCCIFLFNDLLIRIFWTFELQKSQGISLHRI